MSCEFEAEILKNAKEIIEIYENESRDAAFREWQVLDHKTRVEAGALSLEISNLVVELDHFMDDEPSTDKIARAALKHWKLAKAAGLNRF